MADRGGTSGAEVGIVNGASGGEAPLYVQWGAPLERRRGGPLGQQWGSLLDLGLVWEPWLDPPLEM